MDLIHAMTNRNIKSVRVKSIRVCTEECVSSLRAARFVWLVISVTIVMFDFHNAERKELPVIKIFTDEGREDCQQLKPKGTQASLGTTVIAVTTLLILSILFTRVTVNVLVFVLRVVFFM